MSIQQEVTTQLKDAMKAKDKPRVAALRSIRAGIIEAQKADGRDAISDDEVQTILRRLAKQQAESIEAFDKGGRADLATTERAELTVIAAFLPQMADEAQTRTWVQEAVAATGADSMKQMGQVMGRVMGAHRAVVDGKLVQKLVKEALSEA